MEPIHNKIQTNAYSEETRSSHAPLATVHIQWKPDWYLLIATFCLMLVGIMFIISARIGNESTISWYQTNAFRQGIWYLIGSVMMICVCLIDYKILSRF